MGLEDPFDLASKEAFTLLKESHERAEVLITIYYHHSACFLFAFQASAQHKPLSRIILLYLNSVHPLSCRAFSYPSASLIGFPSCFLCCYHQFEKSTDLGVKEVLTFNKDQRRLFGSRSHAVVYGYFLIQWTAATGPANKETKIRLAGL